MCPSAVDGELDLAVKAVGYVFKLDFPKVVSNLVHLVGSVSGIPGSAVQPLTLAVTDCEYGVILKFFDFFNDIALDIGVVFSGIVNNGEGACAGQVEGNVLIGLVADPLCAVLHGLELYSVKRLGDGVILGVVAVSVFGHGVLFVGAVPCSAENVSVRTCYDVSVLNRLGSGFGCGSGGGLSFGGEGSGSNQLAVLKCNAVKILVAELRGGSVGELVALLRGEGSGQGVGGAVSCGGISGIPSSRYFVFVVAAGHCGKRLGGSNCAFHGSLNGSDLRGGLILGQVQSFFDEIQNRILGDLFLLNALIVYLFGGDGNISEAILQGAVVLEVVSAFNMFIGNALLNLCAELLNIEIVYRLRSGAEPLEHGLDLVPLEGRFVNRIGQIGLECVRHLQRVGRGTCLHAVDVCTKGRYLSERSADAVVGACKIVDLLGVSGVLTNGSLGSRLVYHEGMTQQRGVEIQVAGLVAVCVRLEQVCAARVDLGGEQNTVFCTIFHFTLSARGDIEEVQIIRRRHISVHRGGRSLPRSRNYFVLVAPDSIIVAVNIDGMLFRVHLDGCFRSPSAGRESEINDLMTCRDSVFQTLIAGGGRYGNHCRGNTRSRHQARKCQANDL